MSASAFAKTLPTSLSSRTVFVKCSPAPANFTERRAVLKALTTSGVAPDIEVFKRLEDSSSFIAVTNTPGTAKSLVNDSPFKRIVHLQDSTAAATFSTTAWGAAFRRTITDPISMQTLVEAGETAKSQGATRRRAELGLTSKTFTIRVFPANAAYIHRRAIGLNIIHGRWPNSDSQGTFMSNSLRKSIPSGALAPGLRDWETGNQLSGDSNGLEEEGAQSLLYNREVGASKARRLQRKEDREGIPEIMKSLLAVAEAVPQEEAARESPKPAGLLHPATNNRSLDKGHVVHDEFYKAFYAGQAVSKPEPPKVLPKDREPPRFAEDSARSDSTALNKGVD